MTDSVEVRCKNKHVFKVTETDLKAAKNGRMISVKCPECGVSVIMPFNSVGELLDMDMDGVREYIRKKAGVTEVAKKESPKPKPKPRPSREIVQEPDEPDEPVGVEFRPEPVKKTPVVNRLAEVIDKLPSTMKMVEDEPDEPDAGSEPEYRIGETSFDRDLETTPMDILEQVVKELAIEDTGKRELIEFFNLSRPYGSETYGLQPREFSNALSQYGINPAIVKKATARYEFLLGMWRQKRNRAENMLGMFGNPNQNFNFGSPPGAGTGSMYQSSGPSGMFGGQMGMEQPPSMQEQMVMQQMVTAYQQNPQGFFQWLATNDQYIPLWRRVVSSNPMISMPSMGMGSMGGMGMMGMGGPSMMQPQRTSAPSREEIKRMISSEMESIKGAITNAINESSRNESNNTILAALLEMVRDSKNTTHEDPMAKYLAGLSNKLIENQMARDRDDQQQLIGAVFEEMKELKKSLGEGSRGSQTMEEFEKFLKVMQLKSDIQFKERDYQNSEKNREMIKTALDTGLQTIGNVAVALSQKGKPETSQVAQGTRTQETYTLPCENCGTPIVFPKDARQITCAKCGSMYEIGTNPTETVESDSHGSNGSSAPSSSAQVIVEPEDPELSFITDSRGVEGGGVGF
jgi:hypothetical protein